MGGNSAYYRYSDYTVAGTMMARRGYTVDPVVYYAQMITMESPSGQRLSDLLWNMDGDVFEGRDLVWLGDRLIATFEVAESDPDYVLTDHIGYPVMVMDPSANTTWSAVREPYGEAVLTGGTAAGDPLLRYPGQWKDDPAFVVTDPPQRNLFANGYRWYNPDWGRYTQSDPLGVFGDSHPFAYARGNPLLFYDPLGLESLTACCDDSEMEGIRDRIWRVAALQTWQLNLDLPYPGPGGPTESANTICRWRKVSTGAGEPFTRFSDLGRGPCLDACYRVHEQFHRDRCRLSLEQNLAESAIEEPLAYLAEYGCLIEALIAGQVTVNVDPFGPDNLQR